MSIAGSVALTTTESFAEMRLVITRVVSIIPATVVPRDGSLMLGESGLRSRRRKRRNNIAGRQFSVRKRHEPAPRLVVSNESVSTPLAESGGRALPEHDGGIHPSRGVPAKLLEVSNMRTNI